MIVRNDNITEASLGSSVGDSNAQAYINSLLSLGITVTPSKVSAINKLFINLKSSGIYSKIAVMYPMLGGTLGSVVLEARLNSSWDFVIDSAGIVVNDNGITGDNSTGLHTPSGKTLLNIPQSTSGSISANNFSISYYSRIDTAKEFEYAFAITGGGLAGVGLLQNANNTWVLKMGDGDIDVPLTNSNRSGFFTSTRRSSSNFALFKNGSKEFENNVEVNPQFQDINITPLYSSYQNFCWFSIERGLTDEECLSYYNIIQEFQTSLGRAI